MIPEAITDERLSRAYDERGSALLRMFVCLLRGSDRERDPVAAAEDLRQETFLKAWKSREQYDARQEASVETWIYTIAQNAFFDHLRKRRARGLNRHTELASLLLGGGAEHLPSFVAEPTPWKNESYEDLIYRVRHILSKGKYPSYYSFAFLLRAEGYRLEEIAEVTGQNENTLKVALYRTRIFLLKGLAKKR